MLRGCIMASVAVSLDEYLKKSGLYEPDAEYVDGEIQERPMGEFEHALWQKAIVKWFDAHELEWNIRVLQEYRVQVSSTNFRVPDVVVFERALPRERILTSAPLAVFEVLSPEDTVTRMLRKLTDYEAMGVPAIFLVYPEKGVFQQFGKGNLIERAEFSLPQKNISFPFSSIAQFVD
jgi:Uma2 family endonuclease